MQTGWQIVAFPLILPWRKEFWTLPLYFPELKVGVIPDWPEVLAYQGRPLPPEAAAPLNELRHYQPGELLQRQAFKEFLESGEEVDDIIQELKGLPREAPEELPRGEGWSLVWQLEKMQADEEARMIQVDHGEAWLAEILAPEPWDNRQNYGKTGLKEMVDPELARLRYLLWRREMAPHLQGDWAPLLLGRTSRAIFGAIKGWPEWNFIQKVQVELPGVRSEVEWREIAQESGGPAWQARFSELLAACLEAAGDLQVLESRAGALQEFLDQVAAPAWTREPVWRLELEIWAFDPEEEDDWRPVLCWPGAGADILPG
jgi:hypothetical protein